MNHNEKNLNLDQTTNSAERDDETLDSNYEAEEKITNENNEDIDNQKDIPASYYENLTAGFMEEKKTFYETKQLKRQVSGIFDNFSRVMKDSIIVVADEGVGKTSVVESLAQRINDKKCPKYFFDTTVIRITADGFAKYITENQLIHIFTLILNDAKKSSNKIIVNFEDIEEFPECFITEFNSIKSYLTRIEGIDNVWFLLTMNENCYEKLTEQTILSFSKIGVVFQLCPDYKFEDVIKILQTRTNDLSLLHSNVKISNEMLEKIIIILHSRYSNKIQFDFTYVLNVLDLLMAKAENKGKRYVSMNEIKEYRIKDFELMEKESIEHLKAIAYHESGHCLISLLNLDMFKPLAVNIIPDYIACSLGFTISIDRFSKGFVTREIIKKECAYCLGGKYSQEKFNSEIDLNSEDDLIKVRSNVLHWIQDSGSIKNLGIDSVVDDEKPIPEWQSKIIEEECNELIKEARIYTKEMIEKHYTFIQILVENLMKYKILTKKEIFRLWNRYQKENN